MDGPVTMWEHHDQLCQCVDSEIDDVNRFGIWAISHLILEIVTKTVNKFGQYRQAIQCVRT
jgi:hypothetical protein